MSSLIFYTDEAQALIVTDTLAVTQKQNGMFMRCDDSPGFFSWSSGVYKVN